MQSVLKLLKIYLLRFELLAATMLFLLGLAGPELSALEPKAAKIPQKNFMVTTTADSGEGSLRQAILDANANPGPDIIRFDSTSGLFDTPQVIKLTSELPDLVGEVTIDGYIKGRLWKATGVTVSGSRKFRVFRVAPGAKVVIKYLSIADGRAEDGGGIVNRGELIVKSTTFSGNSAANDGGVVANMGGTLTIINSTLVDNRAGNRGGALADTGGSTTVTNCTFSGNVAKKGGGLFSSGTLLVRNTILANSQGSADCVAAGTLDAASTNNLIETNESCGTPISTADPRLQKMGFYNGPTRTVPLGGGSHAINMGDNASAVDETGKPLRWDQRGNGDPRFVGGITDIGAFERQALPVLMVDTVADVELRVCTRRSGDCSLRGAVTLANATEKADTITFDPKVFAVPQTIKMKRPLPDLTTDMTIDAGKTAGVIVKSTGQFKVFNIVPAAKVKLINIKEE
jgi:predicted outer membrane repeat protein